MVSSSRHWVGSVVHEKDRPFESPPVRWGVSPRQWWCIRKETAAEHEVRPESRLCVKQKETVFTY